MLNKTNIRTKEKHQTIIKTSTQGFKQLLQLNIGTFTFTNENRLMFCLCSFIGKPGSPDQSTFDGQTLRTITVSTLIITQYITVYQKNTISKKTHQC